MTKMRLALCMAVPNSVSVSFKELKMALPPAPIDHAFSNPETFKDSLINAKEFKLAIEKAKVAFLETENAIEDSKKEGHILCGASPSQAARQAFLTTLSGQN